MDKRFRILAVDDEYVNIQLIKSVLGEEYDILTALNGLEAIDQIEQYKPDLILLDVMMPDITGFEVCKMIKADERFADIPVIFLTALDSQDDQLQGLELGGIDYLTKPINFALLKLRVRNHLAMKEQRDQLIRQKEELAEMLEEQELQNEQLREAKNTLLEAEWKFKALFDNGPIGVAYHSMIYDDSGKAVDYRFIDANDKYIKLTGVDPRGKTVLQAFPGIENDPFDWIGTFGNVARTGETIHFESYLQPNDRWYDVVGYQYKPDHFVAAFFDITERKKIDEVQSYLLQISSLSTGDDFFELLARYLANILGMDYVCIDILHGDCLSASTLAIYNDGRFEDNFEYTLKDTPCGDVVGKEVSVFPRGVCLLFPQDPALQDLQAESYVGTTLWSFDMKPIGLIAVIGRKELNSSLFAETVLKLVSIRAAGELERRQVDKEKQALEQQFQQTQKLESLGVLAGGIAHDFNNILAIIIGHCSLAAMNPDAANDHIQPIEKAADRAAGLCRQMLAYAGKASFSLTQVNMSALVDEMVQMLKATTNQNVAIKPAFSPDVPTIIGDASQLRQVIMNLIINASEAIGEAQGVIHISLTKTSVTARKSITDHLGKVIRSGWYACLEVADTGCGMDDETRRKIFEPFYTTKFTGRGLGMSAVLGIITAHKGALRLTSQSGQGTTFTIYLPIETSEPIGDESSEQIVSTPWQGSGTILLVEDEEQVKLVAKAMLKALGFKVVEASNGMEALDLYQNNAAAITMVMTDIGMPVMDGYTLFRELKSLKPELPIIISSGFGDTVVTTRIPSGEIAGLVSKPYRFDQLRDVLKSVVEVAESDHS